MNVFLDRWLRRRLKQRLDQEARARHRAALDDYFKSSGDGYVPISSISVTSSDAGSASDSGSSMSDGGSSGADSGGGGGW